MSKEDYTAYLPSTITEYCERIVECEVHTKYVQDKLEEMLINAHGILDYIEMVKNYQEV